MKNIFFIKLEIKVIDNIIAAGTCYSSLVENGALPSQSVNKANYGVIALGGMAVEEDHNSFQCSRSF